MAVHLNNHHSLSKYESILKESRMQRPKDLRLIFRNTCRYLRSVLAMEPSLQQDARFAEGLGIFLEEGKPFGERLGTLLTETEIKIISLALEAFDRPDTLFDMSKYSYFQAFCQDEEEGKRQEEEGVEPEPKDEPPKANPRSCSFFSFLPFKI